jgi:hypothetical protein
MPLGGHDPTGRVTKPTRAGIAALVAIAQVEGAGRMLHLAAATASGANRFEIQR